MINLSTYIDMLYNINHIRIYSLCLIASIEI